jgi:para-nitrobenzyl esterase
VNRIHINTCTIVGSWPIPARFSLLLCLIATSVLWAATLAGCGGGTTDGGAEGPVVVTESGPLRGIAGDQVNEYLGIPYAAPPVGNLRWMPPKPYGRWHGILQATQFGNVCPQEDGAVIGSENCLFLNVYAPHARKKRGPLLPVMVWIHGGGLTAGSSEIFDPTPLVEHGNLIVVTINYRIGLLGFFAHPAIDTEGHPRGNYGLMDQQFALQWVRQNILEFGGNNQLVTIFGQSAGGLSAYCNLASPPAAGLFQRAI